ncbi:hypothetical protein EW146_g2808 [Bondarzewia mesenterica]|uniref:Enoyl-CoA hydratase n=1 Tax=Bondarzewia mesenterica TaxID=1095465 RepID=A0A4S4M1U7_9AGAM|nr:hypothetical protein EW146_g2808 [Bondarzewia mesenterica]
MSTATYPLHFPAGASTPLLTVTRPKTAVWQIELHNGADSRLTRDLIDGAFKPALDVVEKDWRDGWRAAAASKNKNETGGAGSLVIIGNRAQDKFFSNGFDYPSVIADPNWFTLTFNPLLLRLLTFPVPTVVAINGHCFAAGCIISLACDYRVMTDGSKRNAWMFILALLGRRPSPTFCAQKVPRSTIQRKVALEGHRFTPQEAVDAELVDELVSGGTEDILRRAIDLAQAKTGLASKGVWGLIKTELYRTVMEGAQRDIRAVTLAMDDAAAKARL